MKELINNTTTEMNNKARKIISSLITLIIGLIGLTAPAAATGAESDLINVVTEFEDLMITIGVGILFIYIVFLVLSAVINQSRTGVKRIAAAVVAIIFLLLFRDIIVPVLESITGNTEITPDAAIVIANEELILEITNALTFVMVA